MIDKNIKTIFVNFDDNWKGEEDVKNEFIEHTFLLFNQAKYNQTPININIKEFTKEFFVVGFVKVHGLRLVFDVMVDKFNPNEALEKGVGEISDALIQWYEKNTISQQTLKEHLKNKKESLKEGDEFIVKNSTGSYFQMKFGENIKMVKEYVDIQLFSNYLISLIKDALFTAFSERLEKSI